MARLWVGTSGYVYAHWRDRLYPPGLPPDLWLSYYAGFFGTCELNATFYRLPEPGAVERWRDGTPPDFLFACKGSRFLTHMKVLTDTTTGLDRFFAPIRRLGVKLGPVLWQLPARLSRPNPERLDRFLAALPPGRHAFEFRHPSWYSEEICEVLDRRGAAFCEHDLLPTAPPRRTGGFRYLRFHGASAPYCGRYGLRALEPYAKSLLRSHRRGEDAYVYFNNDLEGHAIYDALELLERLGVAAGPTASEARLT